MSQKKQQNQLPLFAEGSPVRMSRLPDAGRAWLESARDFGMSFIEFSKNSGLSGSLSKTSLACYRAADVLTVKPLGDSCGFTPGSETARALSSALSALPESECLKAIEAATSPSSFQGWRNSGIAHRGGFLTLNTSEFPSDVVASSLSDILEADVPPRYFLSGKAARGILRRAAKRGKSLPPSLQAALEQTAQQNRQNPTPNLAPTLHGGSGNMTLSGAVTAKQAKQSGGPSGDEAYNLVVEPIAIRPAQTGSNGWGILQDGTTHTLDQTGGDFIEIAPTLDTGYYKKRYSDQQFFSQSGDGFPITAERIRRLTPGECEKLQGFPVKWTEKFSDSTRYKMMGNAVAVPVVAWIGRRIMQIHKETK